MDTKQVDIAELAERAKKREIDALKSFISEVNDDFTLPVAKIPESVFVDYFLDHFKAINNNVEVDPTLTAKWVSIVGSPYSPADIVDSKGDVLYSVPPLLARPNVNKRLQQVSFNEVSGRYNAEKNRLESAGENYLHAALNGVSSMVTGEKAEMEKSTVEWMSIFKRYDTPTTPETDSTKKETIKKYSQLDDNLEIEYD